MATPPTFTLDYEVAWSTTTTPAQVNVDAIQDDVFVIVGGSEAEGRVLGTPSGGTFIYTLQQKFDGGPNYATAYAWTMTATSAGNFNISDTSTNTSLMWGFTCLRFGVCTGVGASAVDHISSGAPTLNITTTADNSALVVVVTDYAALDGAARVWRTVNGITPTSPASSGEVTYFRNAANYTSYAAYYADAGTAGVCTVGLSAPGGQKYTIAAVELLGTSTGAIPGNQLPVGTRGVTAIHQAAGW